MALYYSRLGLENKFLENKSGKSGTLWRCFYHTDLGQDRMQYLTISLIKYSGQWKHTCAGAFSEIVKYGQLALTFDNSQMNEQL